MEHRSNSMLLHRQRATSVKRQPISSSTGSKSFTPTSSGAGIGRRDAPSRGAPPPPTHRSGPTMRPSSRSEPCPRTCGLPTQRRMRMPTGSFVRNALRVHGARPRPFPSTPMRDDALVLVAGQSCCVAICASASSSAPLPPGLPVIASSGDQVGTRPRSAAARRRPAISIGAR